MPIIADLKIKLFADSAEQNAMLVRYHDPLIKGFTTNPMLIRKANIGNYQYFALEILKIIKDKPVSFAVFADEFEEMEQQAYQIAAWGKNAVVKIPVTNARGEFSGKLIKKLAHDNIYLNITAILTLQQVKAVAACLSKATPAILSIFAGRIADTGNDPMPVMQQALKLLEKLPNAELLWASPRELLNIIQADDIGCHIITLTDPLLNKLFLLEKNLEEYALETVQMLNNDALAINFNALPIADTMSIAG